MKWHRYLWNCTGRGSEVRVKVRVRINVRVRVRVTVRVRVRVTVTVRVTVRATVRVTVRVTGGEGIHRECLPWSFRLGLCLGLCLGLLSQTGRTVPFLSRSL
jgi:hypothetical protein